MTELEFIPAREPMLRALELAREAGDEGEVPVGAVVVYQGKIISEGTKQRHQYHTHKARRKACHQGAPEAARRHGPEGGGGERACAPAQLGLIIEVSAPNPQ